MSYQWIDASTAEGRERLEEFGAREVVAKLTAYGLSHLEEIQANAILCSKVIDEIEFLDPDQDNQIAALKAENKQLLKACQDSAGKEIVDNVLHDRQVSEL